MYSFSFMDFEVYYLLFYFVIFSFLGWAMETIRVSVKSNKFVNRGFANGPYCPIYGFGMLFVILFLSELKNNYILLFIGGLILCTFLEYFTSYILEVIFKAKWWDYSYKKHNIKGRICLDISLAWGFLSLVMIEFVVPLFDALISHIPRLIGVIILDFSLSIMLIDVIITFHSLLSLNKVLATISIAKDEIKEEFSNYMNTLSDNIRENLSENAEEFSYKFENAAKKYIQYKENVAENLKTFLEENNIKSLEDIFENFSFKDKLNLIREKYQATYNKNRLNFIQKRVMTAFPKLKYNDKNKNSIIEALRERFDKRIDK